MLIETVTDVELRRLVAVNGYAAYLNTVVGKPAPRVQVEFERSSNPEPGDLVLETTSSWLWANHESVDPGAALGILLRSGREPIMNRHDFDQMHADGEYWNEPGEAYEDIPTEQIYYIRPLDGSVDEVRWHNASFIRIHSEMPSV